jgi:glucose/mannose-6-phosphate isomerase
VTLDAAAALAAADPGAMLAAVAGAGDQARAAAEAAKRADLAGPRPDNVAVAGMGGSGVTGDVLAALAFGESPVPVVTAKGDRLPAFVGPGTLLIAVSYSGNTEEALACYEASGMLGAHRIVVSSGGELARMARKDDVPVIPVAGGLQPRAAVAYMTIAALEVAWLCGAGPRMTTEVDVAAEHLEELVTEWGPDGSDDSEAKVLARGLHGAVPVISGSGLTEAVAYRWKTQINENAKLPAFANELPELDHNEICGWSGAGAIGRFAAVFLDDPDTHPRVRDRIELTEGIIREQGHATFVAGSRGQTRVERVMSLVLLGDLVSLYLAVLRGIDPTPVDVIETLKSRLSER